MAAAIAAHPAHAVAVAAAAVAVAAADEQSQLAGPANLSRAEPPSRRPAPTPPTPPHRWHPVAAPSRASPPGPTPATYRRLSAATAWPPRWAPADQRPRRTAAPPASAQRTPIGRSERQGGCTPAAHPPPLPAPLEASRQPPRCRPPDPRRSRRPHCPRRCRCRCHRRRRCRPQRML